MGRVPGGLPGDDLEEYVVWAREQGGVPRYVPGSQSLGPAGGLSDRSVRADEAVLRELAGHVKRQGGVNPDDPAVLMRAAESMAAELRVRRPLSRRKGSRPPQPREGTLSSVTVERYLVVLRRYLRFRGVLGEGTKPPWLSGPHVDRSRRVLAPDALDRWFEVVEGSDDRRVEIATWLLLARVPVASLTTICFGDVDLKAGVVNTGGFALPFDRRLGDLLEADGQVAASTPVLCSNARWHHGQVAPLTGAGLRSLWNDRRVLVPGGGPTMAAVLAVGRMAVVERQQGFCVYRLRS